MKDRSNSRSSALLGSAGVLIGILVGVANLIFMLIVGFGGLSNTRIGNSEPLLASAYLSAEVLLIFVLLSWVPKAVRNVAHAIFFAPWGLLVLMVLPQMMSEQGLREGGPLLLSAALVWLVKYPGEWIARRLGTGPAEDAVGDARASLRPAGYSRLLIWLSITWAATGTLYSTFVLELVPVIGKPLSLVIGVVYSSYLPVPLSALLLAAPGVILARQGHLSGAPASFPRFPRIAWWCAGANLVAWLSLGILLTISRLG